MIFFRKNKQPVQAADNQYRNERGELVFRQGFDCSEKTEASPIIVHLPTALVSKEDRKVEALAYVYSKQGDFLDGFKAFDVHFPKP